MKTVKLTKALKADTIEEISEKINAFSKVKKVFATQVFPREEHNEGGGSYALWYEALCYYEEEIQ